MVSTTLVHRSRRWSVLPWYTDPEDGQYYLGTQFQEDGLYGLTRYNTLLGIQFQADDLYT